jgi:hypothetical protein
MGMACIRGAKVPYSRHEHSVIIYQLQGAVSRHHEMAVLHVAMGITALLRLFGESRDLFPEVTQCAGVETLA